MRNTCNTSHVRAVRSTARPLLLGVVLALMMVTAPPLQAEDLPPGNMTRVFVNADATVVERESFFFQHGFVLGPCEDGEPNAEQQDLLTGEHPRFVLYQDDDLVDPSAVVTGCQMSVDPDGNPIEMAVKVFRFEYRGGLGAGTYEFRGEWFLEDGPPGLEGEMTLSVLPNRPRSGDTDAFSMFIITPDAVDGMCTYTAEMEAHAALRGVYTVELVVTHSASGDVQDSSNLVVLNETWEIDAKTTTWSVTAQPVTHERDGHFHIFEMSVYRGGSVVFYDEKTSMPCPDPS